MQKPALSRVLINSSSKLGSAIEKNRIAVPDNRPQHVAFVNVLNKGKHGLILHRPGGNGCGNLKQDGCWCAPIRHAPTQVHDYDSCTRRLGQVEDLVQGRIRGGAN